jgi:hypothetical protein
MNPLALLNHTLNFLAPALCLAVLLPLSARLFWRKLPRPKSLKTQVTVLFAVGVMVLVAGLVLFGRDGKMFTYLGLVLAMASGQWVMQKR